MKSLAKSHLKLLPVILGIIGFWLFRLFYWNITFEIPFSDMADYNNIAFGILKSWNFSHSPFWQSYQSPGLPVLRALQILLLGADIRGWQLFQTLLIFLGLIWLARELNMLAKKQWLGITLIWIVAISKSSIFWSYKIASEGVGEAFIYLICASSLFALRKKNAIAFFLTGLIYAAGFLIRPNFFVAVPLFILFFLISPACELFQKKRSAKKNTLIHIKLVGYFFVGVFLLWSPWLIRTYRLYGRTVLFNTHGAYTFFWELGNVPIKENGKTTYIHVNALQTLSETKFRNDYEAMTYANRAMVTWMREHWKEYPSIIAKRILNSIQDNDVHLTKVSRTKLFPQNINLFLIDKSVVSIVSGIIGLLFLSFFIDRFFIVVAISLGSWLSTAVILGYARMLEPVIPLILFGNVGWILLFNKIIKRDI